MPKDWRFWLDVPAWEASNLHSPRQNQEAHGRAAAGPQVPSPKRTARFQTSQLSPLKTQAKK